MLAASSTSIRLHHHDGELPEFSRATLCSSSPDVLLLEGVQGSRLASVHPIFHTQFPIEESSSSTQLSPGDPRWKGAAEALYGVYDDDRMVMLLSQLHLQCGWRENPAKQERKMKQIANIYVYAMTH